jgi:hypothetical protein
VRPRVVTRTIIGIEGCEDGEDCEEENSDDQEAGEAQTVNVGPSCSNGKTIKLAFTATITAPNRQISRYSRFSEMCLWMLVESNEYINVQKNMFRLQM